jgi:hypothetical protein
MLLLLADAGYSVRTARNGKDALEAADVLAKPVRRRA